MFNEESIVPILAAAPATFLPSHTCTRLASLLVLVGTMHSAPAMAMNDDPGEMDPPKKMAAEGKAQADEKKMEAKKDEAKPADGKKADPREEAAKTEALLKDFIHYILIDRADAATSMGQALLDKNMAPARFARLVETSDGYNRFSRAISQAQRNREIEPVASKLLKLYEEGKLASVRSPAQVGENIKLLTGNQQQRLTGQDRLKRAKEYAMPQLLQALVQKSDARLSSEVRQLMVDMGRDSIIPLVTALPDLDPVSQQVVCDILGDIEYPTSVPFLHQLMTNSTSPEVQRSAEEAIRRIVGVVNTNVSISNRFADLAENFYSESPSITSFTGEPNQLWWSYDPGAGLVMQAVDSSVWHEAMAMRLCETALKEDASNAHAISLWIASNFSREIDTPKDYENPAYGNDRREAMYYAVAAGPIPAQRVLARGIDGNDTPLSRKALAALEQTAGGATLWAGQGDRRPLLEALRYPNRRVQYEAALALGAAGPKEAFESSDQVVRILGSAVRDASARYALVIAAQTSSEKAAGIADALRAQGYTLLPIAPRLADVAQPIAEAPGVDIIVSDLPSTATAELIAEAQSNAKLRATPILALLSAEGYAQQASKYARDSRVRLVREGASSQDVAEAARQLLEVAIGGPVSAEEAEAYRTRCLSVLRDLAVSGNGVLNVQDAADPLVATLPSAKGELKMQIAEVLSFVGTKPAQGAVMEAAMAASGEERIALLSKVTASARRVGNQLEQRHIDSLKRLATTATGNAATAAAALMGALNLPNSELVPLILGAMK